MCAYISNQVKQQLKMFINVLLSRLFWFRWNWSLSQSNLHFRISLSPVSFSQMFPSNSESDFDSVWPRHVPGSSPLTDSLTFYFWKHKYPTLPVISSFFFFFFFFFVSGVSASLSLSLFCLSFRLSASLSALALAWVSLSPVVSGVSAVLLLF